MEDNYQTIELTYKDSITSTFEIPPHDRVMGDEVGKGSILKDLISIRIGIKPIIYNLKKLYEMEGKKIPSEIQIFTSYNIWIVNYYVSVLKLGGYDGIKQIGLKVDYKQPSTINILDVLPKTEFIKKIDGKLTFDANIGLNGQANFKKNTDKFSKEDFSFGFGGKLNFSTDNSLVGNLSFSVLSPSIMSTGVGSNLSEWVINKENNPLYGDDLMFTNIILVDRFTNTIEVNAMVYSTISIYNLIPSRRSSKWIGLSLNLEN